MLFDSTNTVLKNNEDKINSFVKIVCKLIVIREESLWIYRYNVLTDAPVIVYSTNNHLLGLRLLKPAMHVKTLGSENYYNNYSSTCLPRQADDNHPCITKCTYVTNVFN